MYIYAPYSYIASNKTIDNEHTVRIEFQSMNYENGAMSFIHLEDRALVQ